MAGMVGTRGTANPIPDLFCSCAWIITKPVSTDGIVFTSIIITHTYVIYISNKINTYIKLKTADVFISLLVFLI